MNEFEVALIEMLKSSSKQLEEIDASLMTIVEKLELLTFQLAKQRKKNSKPLK